MLTVTVLGSAGTFAYPGNPCSGYLVQTPTTSIWLDAGPGTFAALQEHVSLADVDAIVLSHEHPDHWIELPVVRNAARYVMDIAHLPVYGTAGTRRLAEAVMGSPLPPPVEWTEISDGSSASIGDVNLVFAATDHPVETLAVRVEAHDRVMVYSADTGPAWSFASLDPEGIGFDLALCEATLTEAQAGMTQHLSGGQAGAMARAAGVRRLAITHLYEGVGGDRVDAASGDEAFGGPVEVALSGHIFTV